ncbi:AraC family transcriptional regulator [Paenibacillus sp. LHD-117]|uniref:AraC family transcriptional regulator n=1 Tax=Paenibacillus sp. LHD-117 TaxID=3071412 RepID=UPI0027E0B3B7|nr:AraC family transcriptional regulator [Paenibacillus sp. LHD-117]MDQ6422942.1 AraC family transcriptional regulator [Paenibacillus sp. LHD-117]
MTLIEAGQAARDMVLNMQVEVLEARLTQCWTGWRELDYRPAYNKLYFILEGDGWLKIGDRELYPEPGQLILMPAHKQQSYSAINDRPYYKYWCHFTAVTGQTDVFQWLDMPYCFEGLDRSVIEELFRELVAAHGDHSIAARLKEKSVLLHILSILMEAQPLRIRQSQTHEMERLTLIQQYVDEHLDQEVTLEELAEVLHLHPNYFSKYFKRHFGVPPLKYVSRKRMEHAKLLLKTTARSVKEVAAATGFDDANYFSKTFRREVGYSPSEYRLNV